MGNCCLSSSATVIPFSIAEEMEQSIFRNCRIMSVQDANNIIIVIPYRGIPTRFNCRLFGVSCPEIIHNDIGMIHESNRIHEIKKALDVRLFLIQWMIDSNQVGLHVSYSTKSFIVKTHGFDEYGRLLVELFKYDPVSECSVNKLIN